MEIRKTAIKAKNAVRPNSCNTELPVNVNTPNPTAVVRLVNNTALPTLDITRCKASILLPCALNSSWYLLSR